MTLGKVVLGASMGMFFILLYFFVPPRNPVLFLSICLFLFFPLAFTIWKMHWDVFLNKEVKYSSFSIVFSAVLFLLSSTTYYVTYKNHIYCVIDDNQSIRQCVFCPFHIDQENKKKIESEGGLKKAVDRHGPGIIKGSIEDNNSNIKFHITEAFFLVLASIAANSLFYLLLRFYVKAPSILNNQGTTFEGKEESKIKYKVGLSYASEQEDYVETVARLLKAQNIEVFFDKFEDHILWGKDLYQHLNEIYKVRCEYCIIFISKDYSEKLWTKHELRSAQARAFVENREYILPIRFDDTELPGIDNTVGYIDARETTPENIAELVYKKLQ